MWPSIQKCVYCDLRENKMYCWINVRGKKMIQRRVNEWARVHCNGKWMFLNQRPTLMSLARKKKKKKKKRALIIARKTSHEHNKKDPIVTLTQYGSKHKINETPPEVHPDTRLKGLYIQLGCFTTSPTQTLVLFFCPADCLMYVVFSCMWSAVYGFCLCSFVLALIRS